MVVVVVVIGKKKTAAAECEGAAYGLQMICCSNLYRGVTLSFMSYSYDIINTDLSVLSMHM